ncbi:MAG: hypothetical protein J6Z11_03415 [Candidatus Riflebacteria bacterium]|nr:hypothetical protein [Candidatus Riflebacteria bacterium]
MEFIPLEIDKELMKILAQSGAEKTEAVGIMLFLTEMDKRQKMLDWINKNKKIYNQIPTINEISTQLGEFIKEYKKDVKPKFKNKKHKNTSQ